MQTEQIISCFIATPGIEECSNYIIIQRLIEHRIRCVLMGSEFSDISRDLVLKFMTPPDDCITAEQMNKFVDIEAMNVLATFKLYEQLPSYQEAIEALKQHAGKQFTITSMTMTGIQILIYE